MTTISIFNAKSSHPIGKIHIKCQLSNLETEVMCHVIDAHMSYNILLQQLWIHANLIVPSTLYQCFTYVCRVKTVYTEKQLFERLENYFTNSILYQKEYEINVNSDRGH